MGAVSYQYGLSPTLEAINELEIARVVRCSDLQMSVFEQIWARPAESKIDRTVLLDLYKQCPSLHSITWTGGLDRLSVSQFVGSGGSLWETGDKPNLASQLLAFDSEFPLRGTLNSYPRRFGTPKRPSLVSYTRIPEDRAAFWANC